MKSANLTDASLQAPTNVGFEVRSMFDRPVPAVLTPLTGRDGEVGLLADRWEQVQEGMGQLVLVVGDPGLGKSRLVHTIKELVLAPLHLAPIPAVRHWLRRSLSGDALNTFRIPGCTRSQIISSGCSISDTKNRPPLASTDWPGTWRSAVSAGRNRSHSSPRSSFCRRTSAFPRQVSPRFANVRKHSALCASGCRLARGNSRCSSWSKTSTGWTPRASSSSGNSSPGASTIASSRCSPSGQSLSLPGPG